MNHTEIVTSGSRREQDSQQGNGTLRVVGRCTTEAYSNFTRVLAATWWRGSHVVEKEEKEN